jgi:hypothetical protein
MRLAQIVAENGKRALVVSARGESRLVKGARTTRALAAAALAEGAPLRKIIAERGVGKPVDLAAALKEKRLLPPIDHDDPAHLVVSGARLDAAEAGEPPQWFYKGDGATLAPPGGDLASPSFALGGEGEAELVGVYLIDDKGQPVRLGFALGDEFSDAASARQSRLRFARAELGPSSFGPELLIGDLPAEIRGFARVRRGKEIVWEAPFAWGEQSARAIAALEAHHFKYAQFRRPGDVHVLFLAAPPLADSAQMGKGDVLEIESEPFGLPLRNRLWTGKAEKVRVRGL